MGAACVHPVLEYGSRCKRRRFKYADEGPPCSLNHAHIIMMHGACMAWPHICIVEELATGGSLHDLLHPTGRPDVALPLPQVTLCSVSHSVKQALLRACYCARYAPSYMGQPSKLIDVFWPAGCEAGTGHRYCHGVPAQDCGAQGLETAEHSFVTIRSRQSDDGQGGRFWDQPVQGQVQLDAP